MRQYAYLTQFGHPYFKKAFIFSVSLHLVMFTLTVLLPLIPMFKGKKGAVKYSETIRVDLVELPDHVIHKINRRLISTRDAIKRLRKKTNRMTYKASLKYKTKQAVKRRQQKMAIANLKKMEVIEEKEIEVKKEVERKGNVKSEGAPAPLSAEGSEALDAYRTVIIERIKLRWALPSFLRRQRTLRGEIIVFLSPDGTVIRKQIVSSGNREFDEYMNQSLDEALPFPEVPKESRKDLRYDGVSITFLSGELR